ncbi:hypothetical protein D3C85_1046570 [compost metagenome]|uniref:hypothetical protein n=1 Tax=unclassified Pseudomonas TaxID=196821 RepID=UPI000FC2F195|nr:hypothetical protein [Pseudomonas sp. MPC6]QCY13468.1 hypothetical protein ELQ88_23415 [Pseudomonas sp. MPC6]
MFENINVMSEPRVLSTYDGDELIIHPGDPERIYVLPRHSEAALVAGHGLVAAIEWLCSSNVLTEAFIERDFEPFDSRVPQ